ncbi:hypothetical protein [Muricomes intestini]|jgi:hypothetical protein|uniref:Uncharacterized protein n=1 Tax=Muricomes intestini TaxID=1796634 RepID=A0A4R3K050_9FIRM|nr:hypothetical protein [Muricomes intestini]TCS75210.1 hypothetical protein EDD59_1305 [Muricomes intestini]HAX50756.1 hypothetical protein [Lachnospiraceae bacterium]HCR84075.1 hypothetical protein [Lachnospiraceae bacterium]
MQYEFLKHFPKRMKNVGLYAVLIQNSVQRTTWKQYGFLTADEQLNLIFAVMLYIMEQSLKEENCTMDDIGAYIDTLNMQYWHKNMNYEDCRQLGDFIVNVILSNDGRVMHFDGFNFEQDAYQIMNISYVANKIVYVEQEVKRTSYYLTDDGYNLLLGTLEIENNMKLTIHEMIFQMHLEKQSYDKAVDEIKNVFNLLRIQMQKIQEAMGKIRRNALNYSVRDYEEVLTENLETIGDTQQKFQNYREMVRSRARELEEENINIKRLSDKEDENLNHLRIIESYLNRAIDEHQKILNNHFDLKALYTKELEDLTQMSLIRRFPLRTKLYDKILEHPKALENLDYFLRPLFNQDAEKVYNLNKAFQYQKPVRKNEEEDTQEELDFDEEAWQAQQERKLKEKLKRYETSLGYLLERACVSGEISLEEIGKQTETLPAHKDKLIPNVEVFKEVMVELIKNREIDIESLKKERSEYIQDKPGEFQLNEMLLKLIEDEPRKEITLPDGSAVHRIETYRMPDGSAVTFNDVLNEEGDRKAIRCSNVLIRVL